MATFTPYTDAMAARDRMTSLFINVEAFVSLTVEANLADYAALTADSMQPCAALDRAFAYVGGYPSECIPH